MEKIKYYDKNVYETEKKIKTAFMILLTFLIGMYIGLAINYMELQKKDIYGKQESMTFCGIDIKK